MKSRYEEIKGYSWTGSPGRIRMPLEQRAKIFAPFAALKGYSELIKKAEEEAMKKYERHQEAEYDDLLIIEEKKEKDKHTQGRESTEQQKIDKQKLYHTTLLYTKGVSNNATEKK